MTSDADRIMGLYERHAHEWDADRGRSLFEKAWLDRFLGLLSPGASILDIGCGSGEPIARYFIEQGCAVTGVDSSPTLIGICNSRFPGREWIVADMRSLDLGRRFDGIIAWDSFFHLSPQGQRRMFPIFRKHARPGAALMFTSGPSYGVAMGSYRGEPLYHASLDADEYCRLLAENEFGVASHTVQDPDCGGHTVWLAQAHRPEDDR